jgi:hypothetical protein
MSIAVVVSCVAPPPPWPCAEVVTNRGMPLRFGFGAASAVVLVLTSLHPFSCCPVPPVLLWLCCAVLCCAAGGYSYSTPPASADTDELKAISQWMRDIIIAKLEGAQHDRPPSDWTQCIGLYNALFPNFFAIFFPPKTRQRKEWDTVSVQTDSEAKQRQRPSLRICDVRPRPNGEIPAIDLLIGQLAGGDAAAEDPLVSSDLIALVTRMATSLNRYPRV